MPMIEARAGKDLPMTRIAIENASQQSRLLYGPVIAELRRARGMSQAELEGASGVTARTIRNIETGKVAGQADNLIRLLIALGVDVDGQRFGEVEPYARMLAPVILRIHPDYRATAVADAIDMLSEAVIEHPNVKPGGANLTPLRRNVRPDDEDLHEVDLTASAERLAASTDDTTPDPDTHTP